MAHGRTALPKHRRQPAARIRSARRVRARGGVRAFLLVTLVAAAAIVGAARFAVFHFAPSGSKIGALLAGVQTSKQAGLLEAQRENMILVADASKSFSLASTPKVASNPINFTPTSPASPGSQGSAPSPAGPVPSPGTAQAIAYKMLASFGWSTSQFSCLNNIWSRESGWRVTAANASGAYGIPQALPGSKMASAGPDWQTNATTQIKWGLGYIKGRYGSPCGAWAFWYAHGWY